MLPLDHKVLPPQTDAAPMLPLIIQNGQFFSQNESKIQSLRLKIEGVMA